MSAPFLRGSCQVAPLSKADLEFPVHIGFAAKQTYPDPITRQRCANCIFQCLHLDSDGSSQAVISPPAAVDVFAVGPRNELWQLAKGPVRGLRWFPECNAPGASELAGAARVDNKTSSS